jgi:NAD(P)H-dependent flavin oxidoreductase YrpB (nitropropane dioxygenase family)
MVKEGDTEDGELPCGQNAGVIHGLKHASEVVESMVSEVSLVMDGLKQKLPAV